MHELSICLSLLDQVERIAREHGADRVERILLRIGPLSGVEAPLLANAYPLAAAGTIAEHATLDIEPAVIRVKCTACGAETEAEPNRLHLRRMRRLAYAPGQRRRDAAGQSGTAHPGSGQCQGTPGTTPDRQPHPDRYSVTVRHLSIPCQPILGDDHVRHLRL